MRPDPYCGPAAARRRGFVLPSALFLLVVLAGLAAWLTSVTRAGQAQAVLELEGERAYQAAQQGLEAGIYEARVLGVCGNRNLALAGQLSRFTASIGCTEYAANESGTDFRLYRIAVVACNEPAAGACPNPAAASAEYVERHLAATAEGGP
jgi:MSHA biogenesis protein MshP